MVTLGCGSLVEDEKEKKRKYLGQRNDIWEN